MPRLHASVRAVTPRGHPMPCAWPRCHAGLAGSALAWPWSAAGPALRAAPHVARGDAAAATVTSRRVRALHSAFASP
jgi:hypothetical protein